MLQRLACFIISQSGKHFYIENVKAFKRKSRPECEGWPLSYTIWLASTAHHKSEENRLTVIDLGGFSQTLIENTICNLKSEKLTEFRRGSVDVNLKIGMIGTTISRVSGFGLSLVLLYCEWLLIRVSFLNVFNPVRQLQAILSSFFLPITWVLIILLFLGISLTNLSEAKK